MKDEVKDRLVRLEEKIDNFNSVLIAIARTEEKVNNIESNNTELLKKVDYQIERQIKIETKVESITETHKTIKRTIVGLFGTSITAIIAAWVKGDK